MEVEVVHLNDFLASEEKTESLLNEMLAAFANEIESLISNDESETQFTQFLIDMIVDKIYKKNYDNIKK
jgi:hypothetical protein